MLGFSTPQWMLPGRELPFIWPSGLPGCFGSGLPSAFAFSASSFHSAIFLS